MVLALLFKFITLHWTLHRQFSPDVNITIPPHFQSAPHRALVAFAHVEPVIASELQVNSHPMSPRGDRRMVIEYFFFSFFLFSLSFFFPDLARSASRINAAFSNPGGMLGGHPTPIQKGGPALRAPWPLEWFLQAPMAASFRCAWYLRHSIDLESDGSDHSLCHSRPGHGGGGWSGDLQRRSETRIRSGCVDWAWRRAAMSDRGINRVDH